MIGDIINTICTSLLTLMGGTASVVWFYNSKKRTEAAKASMAEANVTNTYAEKWKELCERRDKDVEKLNSKIDALYVEMNELRKELFNMKSLYATAQREKESAEYYKCVKRGCKDRIPPNEKL